MYCHFFEPKWYRPAKGFFDFLKISLFYILKFIKSNYSKKYKIYCNSKYTQSWLKKLWEVDSIIIYPPIDIPKKYPKNKKNFILSTGRISSDKNYEFVINLFKKISINFPDYRLFICGKKQDENYLSKLRKMAKGYNIQFKTDLSDKELNNIYSQSKIFIQAKGLNVDSQKYPGLLEHFGMTIVESMSYGCIPLAPNLGGYPETIQNNFSGFIFKNEKQSQKILNILLHNKKKISKMSLNAYNSSKKYSTFRMKKQIDKAIENVTKNYN
jgi:glycosyltransferase involved in cell wall biosynthesis